MYILIGFGLIEITATILTFQQINQIENYAGEYVRAHLVRMFANIIGTDYMEQDSNPYSVVDVSFKRKKYKLEYFLTVIDKNGEIVYPYSDKGKQTRVDLSRLQTRQEMNFWDNDYLIYVDSIPHSNNYLVGYFEKNYTNYAKKHLDVVFILGNIILFVIVILLVWFILLPKLDNTLSKKKAVEWELNHAQQLIQQSLPTGFPKLENAEIYAIIKPTKEVGGDLYDCYKIDNKLYFVMGDVSDKGTLAAQMVMVTGTVLHTQILDGKSILQIVNDLNSLYCRNEQYKMFCTLFIGVINLDTLTMNFCNAGHEKALLIDSDGVRFMEQNSNIVLGALPGYEYKEEQIQLKKDSILIQYTDGITETKNKYREFYGMGGLCTWADGIVKNYHQMSAKDITESLLTSAEHFRGQALQNDDIGIITIKL